MSLKQDVQKYLVNLTPNLKLVVQNIISKYKDDLSDISILDRYQLWEIIQDKELKQRVDKSAQEIYIISYDERNRGKNKS